VIVIKLYNDILETSTDSLYINIMRFMGFFRVQIHSWNANVSWTLQFNSSGRGTAWYWAIPPDRPFYILRYLWSGGGEVWFDLNSQDVLFICEVPLPLSFFFTIQRKFNYSNICNRERGDFTIKSVNLMLTQTTHPKKNYQ